MGIVALAFVALALFCVGLGIAAGAVLCVLAAAFVGYGAVWLSLLVALRTGRAEAGVRAFFVQAGIVMGGPAGALGAFVANEVLAWSGRVSAAVLGALAGAVIGGLLGVGFDMALRRLRAALAARRAATGENGP